MAPWPAYDGQEPCRTVDPELYYLSSLNKLRPAVRESMSDMCRSCHMHDPCLIWALHHEEWGYWAGTTAEERHALRAQLGIELEVLSIPITERGRVA